MDSSEKFWSIFWALVAVVICFVALSIASCSEQVSKNETEVIMKAIAAGVDPIKARCAAKGSALSGSGNNHQDPMCVVAATR